MKDERECRIKNEEWGGGKRKQTAATEEGTQDRLHLHPFAFLVGFFDGGEDALVFQAVFEGGMDGFAFGAGVDEIGDGMDEGVFVADAVAGRPPMADVG